MDETPSGVLTNNQEMKKPTTLEDYKAYAFGFTMIIVIGLTPFAILKVLTYVF
jgi:hypothetical protein